MTIFVDRKLATIRRIKNIEPIKDADKIHYITVDGWKAVSAISNGFSVGDLVLYLEVDSWVPHELAPFLTKEDTKPSIFNGIEGQRLKSIKLKGCLSQGLLIPLLKKNNEYYLNGIKVNEDDDVTEFLKIQKWERPIPAVLGGKIKGNFPDFIPKTNLERIQNYMKYLEKELKEYNETFSIELKMDGSSMTCYIKDGNFGICSRNLEMKVDDLTNSYCKLANHLNIKEYMEKTYNERKMNFAIQGELIGPGIQGNIHKTKELEYHIFDIYDIDKQKYLLPFERNLFLNETKIEKYNIKPISILYSEYKIDMNDFFDRAMEISNSTKLEGIVFKSNKTDFRFKVISNNYLLKGNQ